MTLTQITEKGIKDGEIINADINASAAIASSKLAKPIDFADNEKARFGTGNDLEIYHASNISTINDSYGDLRIMGDTIRIQRQAGGENFLYMTEGGKVALYYDGSEKLETTNGGVSVTGQIVSTLNFRGGDGVELSLGDAEDIKIWHATDADNYIDGNSGQLYIRSNNNIYIQPADNENGVVAIANGAVELYHNNSKKLETGTGGEYGSVIARNGAGGWDGYTMADHVLMGRTSDGSCGLFNDTDNHWAFKTFRNGVIELYYDGSKKLDTASYGVRVSGNLQLDAGTGNDSYIYNSNGGGLIYQADENGHIFKTYSGGWQTRLNITDGGNVGIGTSPATLLHLSRTSTTGYSTTSTTNDSSFLIVNDGAAGHATMQFQVLSGGTANTGQATISAFPENASSKSTSLSFGTRDNSGNAPAERVRINSSGSFMVGTTVDRTAEFSHPDGVSIRGDVKGQYQSTVTDSMNMLLNRDGTDGQILGFRKDGSDIGNIGVSGSNIYFQFGSTGTDAHRLDDYEEGTWTPTFPNNGTGNQALGTYLAEYVKVGRFVYAFMYANITGAPQNSATTWVIGGLPFATNYSSLYHHGTGNVTYVGGNSYSQWRPLVTINTSVYFHRTDGNNAVLQNSDVANEGMAYWIMGLNYMTSS